MYRSLQQIVKILLLGWAVPLMGQSDVLLDPVLAMQKYAGESYCQPPVDELHFEEFLSEMRALPNDRLRFEKIRLQADELCLATPYVYRMMLIMDHPGYEYDMMRICYYYCADPENYNRLLPYMEGAAYRNGMEEFLVERLDVRRPATGEERQTFNQQELTEALDILQGSSSDQSRLLIASELVTRNTLDSDQIRQLADQIDLGRNKKEFLRTAYQTVYDPGNFSVVHEGISRRDQDALMEEIEGMDRSDRPGYTTTRETGCQALLPESEFVSQLRSLDAQWRTHFRLQLAQELFEQHCLTVSELRRVMRLFASDTDRLRLARFAEGLIYDPWNIYQINAEFQQSSTIYAFFQFLSGS